jgi:gliding motility-associated-like protein
MQQFWNVFSSDAISLYSINGPDVIREKPQVNQSGVNKDYGVWKKTFGCFEANGGEQYLTIGNFYDDDHTKAELAVPHYDQGDDNAFYSVDSVFAEEIKEPFIPNVITPNGDKKNDTFKAENIHFGWWALDIYNRWGQSVYHSQDYRNTWDGGNLSPGVYYYDLRHRCPGITYKGALTIIR